jgi:hypothetical protein
MNDSRQPELYEKGLNWSFCPFSSQYFQTYQNLFCLGTQILSLWSGRTFPLCQPLDS